MSARELLLTRYGRPLPLATVPELAPADFRAAVVRAVAGGSRLLALPALPDANDGAVPVLAVLAPPGGGTLALGRTTLRGAYPALTPDCPAAHLFERELAEETGLRPEGHPALQPVRFPDSAAPGVTDVYRVAGAEIHEVAVGPVHAGIIEPGHFRFQCHGERVLHLEIALGYQHRGVERALRGGPNARTPHYIETLAGDTTIGHMLAYAEASEALAGCRVPPRAQALRGIALELERLANHTGDLGALAGDTAFLPTAAYCGRLRGEFLNLTALACGSRFGRGWVQPGGDAWDVDAARAREMEQRLAAALRDLTGALDLLFNAASVLARFENTGVVSRADAAALGLVGVAARASGLEQDARQDFPSGIYRFAHVPAPTWPTGDVFARAYIRRLEIERSAAFLREQLAALPAGDFHTPVSPWPADTLAVACVEGWRGLIGHVLLTDAAGRLARYNVVDPSFHNWAGLALAMRNEAISDFPLCNKSFNLSYCGHDL